MKSLTSLILCSILLVSLFSTTTASWANTHHSHITTRNQGPTFLARNNNNRQRHHNKNHLPLITQRWLPLRGGGDSGSGSSSTKLNVFPSPASVGTTFNNGPFWQANLIFVGANVIGFIISIISGGSHVHLDLIGTGAFAVAATIPTITTPTTIPRIQLSSACVTIWGIKLASFLFFRALNVKHDKRLESLLSTTSGTLSFWLISLVWGILCALPHTLGTSSSYNVPVSSSPCGNIGITLFIIGLVIETLADLQKWFFKQSNPGKFCNIGLWSISQHPNFFGNLLLWFGIFLLNAPALIEPITAAASSTTTDTSLLSSIGQSLWRYRRLALALISPLFLWNLFSSQAKGELSSTLEMSKKKYGNDPAYKSYIKDVPLIIPNILLAFQKK